MDTPSQTTWNPLEEAKAAMAKVRSDGGTASRTALREIAALLDEALSDYMIEQQEA